MKTLPAFYLDFSLLFDIYAPKEQRREGGGKGRGEKKDREVREQ